MNQQASRLSAWMAMAIVAQALCLPNVLRAGDTANNKNVPTRTGAVAEHALPRERLVEDWRRAGVEGGIPNYPVTVELAPGDLPVGEDTNATPIIQAAIDRAPTPGAVLLPEGTFHLKTGILMRNGVVLRGRGLDKTRLIGDAPRLGLDPGTWGRGIISFDGDWGGEEHRIAAGYEAGSKELRLESVAGLSVGQSVLINSDNDLEEMYGTGTGGSRKTFMEEAQRGYLLRSVKQLVRIVEIRGQTVVIDAPARLTRQHLNPSLRPMKTVNWAGVEALYVTRLDTAPGSIIRFSMAENCWVRDCETHLANRFHIPIRNSRFITIEGNYVHEALKVGGGGQGYGIGVGHDCLVWNNVVRSLRHGIVVSGGSSGNVVAYNYLREQRQADGGLGSDISVHGHYPYMELVEGNRLEYSMVCDWWGAAGPFVTFFRNRFDLSTHSSGATGGAYSGDFRVRFGSHQTSIVGNSFVNNQNAPVVERDNRDVWIEGNLVQGRILWNQASERHLPPSLFLDGPPHFWGNTPWPAIGADTDAANAPDYAKIPAQIWGERMLKENRSMPFSAPR